jgi:two-component system sensor histidine kinase QseC
MRSIRTYLLFSLLAIITLVTFFSVLHGYRSSIEKAEQLFDRRLQNLAEIIAIANHDTTPRIEKSNTHSSAVFFQIWSENLTLLLRSHNAPTALLTTTKSIENYKDVNFAGYRWRTYTMHDIQRNRWVVTGERIDVRYSLAENIVTASIIPIVLAIPIAAIIIWWAIGLGLRPLKNLVLQLGNKKADDLSPVVLQNSPQELTQLVTTINDLLRRLNSAFAREQRFSSDAAHELRTPISALKIQIHNLQRSDTFDNNELKPLVAGIERMAYVIEQILSLNRHSPDQGNIDKIKIDLCTVIKKVITDQYGDISLKNQQISLVGDVSCLIWANKFALETLIQNLISNASKYTPEQGEIQVTTAKYSDGIEMIIEDSGSGISEFEIERVFERFYRIDGDQHGSGTIGCGLGLAIVKHIVELHNGHINLSRSSQLGGLKVVIQFPGNEK